MGRYWKYGRFPFKQWANSGKTVDSPLISDPIVDIQLVSPLNSGPIVDIQ